MVHANFGERLGFAPGLKSKVLDYWDRGVGLWSKRITLFQQFVIYACIILGLAMIAVGTWMSAGIQGGILPSRTAAAALYMASVIEPHIQAVKDVGQLSSDDLVNLDNISSVFALRHHIMSIKLWRPDGTIVFNSRRDLIGKKFSNVAFQPSLKGEIKAGIAMLDEDDSHFERTLASPLYEIFAPLYETGTGNVIAVAEFYENAGDVVDAVASTVSTSWVIIGGSFVIMLVALFAIVHRGSTVIERQKSLLKRKLREQARLRRANDELEKKMRHALRESARIDDLIQRRLGAELHDGPAQLVALVLLRLDEISTATEARSASAALVDELRGVASDALKDMRSISHGLFLPSVDGTDSLAAVLERVINAHERRTNSVVDWSVSDIPEHLPMDIIRCVGRVVQEALNNSFKHAAGAGQTVSAVAKDKTLILSIRDSGPGIGESDFPPTDKLGLKSMKFRIEAVGGILELKSQKGTGTEVRCEIPLRPRGM